MSDFILCLLVILILSVFLFYLDKVSLKRADKIFEKRVSYILDQIEERKKNS